MESKIMALILFTIMIISVLVILISMDKDTMIIKEKAYIKPSGYNLEKYKTETETFVITEIKKESIVTYDGWIYQFKTINDTKIRTINTDRPVNVGDIIKFEKNTYQKTCDEPIMIVLPDGFQGQEFKNVHVQDFNMTVIPKYYTDRYDIVVDFSICNTFTHITEFYLTSDNVTVKLEKKLVGN